MKKHSKMATSLLITVCMVMLTACGILTQDKDLGLNEETKPATSFTMEANQ